MSNRLHSNTFDAILCGAGISVDAPSFLPGGEALAIEVVKLLLDSDDVLSRHLVTPPLMRAASSLRLELILEVISQHVPLVRLVEVYKCMRDALPNHNHFALVELSHVRLLTTNQDVLLERAAARNRLTRSVVHLHGVCNRPRTVITAISQYMAGLSRTSTHALRAAVRGRGLLVIGYSGRDRDVMSAVHNSDPSHIVWVRHPGSDLSPEFHQLRASFGRRLTCLTKDASQLLRAMLTPASAKRIILAVASHTPVRWNIPPDVQEAYRGITSSQRNGAIAQVLRHIGEYSLVASVYKAAPASAHSPQLTLARASAHRHLEQYHNALSLYRRLFRRSHMSAYVRSLALLGEIEALRRMSRVYLARRRLGEVKTFAKRLHHRRHFARVHAVIGVIEAGIARAAGDLPAAIAGYEEALRFSKKCRDLETHLEAQVWYADVLRTAGRFVEAHQQLEECVDESKYYTRKFTRGWVSFVTAEVCLAKGDLVAARKAIQTARYAFQWTRNTQGIAWVELLSGVLARVRGKPHIARNRLRAVAAIRRRANTPMALLAVRLELERAELARIKGNVRNLRLYLCRARRLAQSVKSFGHQPKYLLLHCELVALEWARHEGTNGAAEALGRLATDYDTLGFFGCGARARVAAWLANGNGPRPPGLLSECRQHGREWEVAQLRGRQSSSYPILFA